MGFFKNYRQRRLSLTGPESLATLAAIERFFQGGRNWTQGAYHRLNGDKCIVGAAQSMRVGAIDDARYWIRQAIVELHPGYRWLPVMQIEAFNDSHSFAEVAEVIDRAKQLARAAQFSPPPQRPALTYQPEEARPVVELDLADLERVAVRRRE